MILRTRIQMKRDDLQNFSLIMSRFMSGSGFRNVKECSSPQSEAGVEERRGQ